MSGDEGRQVRVGAITLVLVIAALSVVLGLGGVDLRRSISIEVEFTHVGSLKEGADVQIAGRVVGRVTTIALADGAAIAHVSLERRFVEWAPSNAEVFVSSKGLLSQRYLELGPPSNGAPPAAPVVEGARLAGIAPIRTEMVILRSIENTKRFRDLLRELAPEARKLAEALDELGRTLRDVEGKPGRLQALATSGQRLLTSFREARELLDSANALDGRVGKLIANASRVGKMLRLELDALRSDMTLLGADLERLGKLRASESITKVQLAIAQAQQLVSTFERTAAAAREISARIDRGEGTVGGLLHDPEFIDEAKQLGRIIKRQPWKLIGTSREPSKLE